MTTYINADDGIVSGVAGLKYGADNSGSLVLQTNGTTAITISAAQVVTFTNPVSFATASFTDLSYTGTLTGGTGVVNLGSGQFYKDASGNVGIGTSSPSVRLSANIGTFGANNNTLGSAIGVVSSSSPPLIGLRWTNANTGIAGAPFTSQIVVDSTNSPNAFEIYATGTTPLIFGNSSTERMRIDSSGNVGIGTSTVTYGTLQVNGAITASAAGGFYSANYITAARNPIWRFGDAQTYGISYFQGAAGTGSADTVGFHFGTATAAASVLQVIGGVGVTIVGALSKSSGSFRIDHPLPELEETHQLVHSFVEAPMADLIYRGVAKLVKGKATVNIDEAATMTEGTFVALCRTVQCFTTNESDWTAVRGKVSGNILTIEAQDQTSTANISWMVIGERQDKHMLNTGWTDDTGRVIVEPLKPKASAAK